MEGNLNMNDKNVKDVEKLYTNEIDDADGRYKIDVRCDVDMNHYDIDWVDHIHCGYASCADYLFRKDGEIVWRISEGPKNELEFYNKEGKKVMWLEQDGILHAKKFIEE